MRLPRNIVLGDDENLVAFFRQKEIVLVLNLLPSIVVVVLAFFFLYPLFSLGNKGTILFGLMIAGGLLLGLRAIFIYRGKIFIITNKRIIDLDRQSLFKKVVSSILLTDIKDVYYQIKGFFPTIFGMGTVNIILNDARAKIEILNINNPQKIQQLVLDLKNQQLNNSFDAQNLSAAELINLVKKIKAGIGEEKFQQLLGDELNNED